MRKVIVASHGLMAKGVKNSVEMISGPQSNLLAFRWNLVIVQMKSWKK